jgi:hypothetical protein
VERRAREESWENRLGPGDEGSVEERERGCVRGGEAQGVGEGEKEKEKEQEQEQEQEQECR